MILIYLLASIGLLWVLTKLYRALVPAPDDRPPAALEGSPFRSTSDVLTVLGSHLNAPVCEGNRVVLLENGDEIFPSMLEAISSARSSVHLLTYIYWTGAIAERFASALAEASARGVTVRLLLDAYGARLMRDPLIERLEGAGVEIAWFHPLLSFDLQRLNNRTHRKVLVVDGRVAFTGGVGIAEEWTGHAQDAEHWRDDHFRLEGPVVAALQGAFAEEWLSATGHALMGAELYPPPVPVGEARCLPLLTSPRARWSPVAYCYWWALRTAREQVDIATPYFVPDEDLLQTILETARRGVRVRLLLPNDHNDSIAVRWASRACYPDLIENGVELYEFIPTMMHTKTLCSDGRWCFLGSANFDNRSFALNDEVTVMVDDPGLAADLTRSFEADLTRSQRIHASTYRSIGWTQRALSHAALLLRAQL